MEPPVARETSPTLVAARQLWHVVMLLMRAVAADMRRSPQPLEPGQVGALMRVSAGPCTMSELARHLSISLPTVSKTVDLLVRRGWLERWIDERDRRQTMLRLTGSGRRALNQVRQRAERRVARTLAPLGAARRRQLVASLGALEQVLQRAGGRECAPETDG